MYLTALDAEHYVRDVFTRWGVAGRKKSRRPRNRDGFRPNDDGQVRHRQMRCHQIGCLAGIVLADDRIIACRHIDAPATAYSEFGAALRFLPTPTAVSGAERVMTLCLVLPGCRSRNRAARQRGQLDTLRPVRVRADHAGPKEAAGDELECQHQHRDVGGESSHRTRG